MLKQLTIAFTESEIAKMEKAINLKIGELEAEYYRLRYHQQTVRTYPTLSTGLKNPLDAKLTTKSLIEARCELLPRW